MNEKRILFKDINESMKNIEDTSPFSNILKKMHEDVVDFETRKGDSFKDASIRIHSDCTSGTIDFDTLNSVLTGLQEFSISAFNDKYGTKSEMGKIPFDILSQSKLILTGVSPGSFIVSFDALQNKQIEKQLTLFPIEENNVVDVISEALKDVSEINVSEKATEFVEKFGKRTYKHTLKWFAEIERRDIAFEYNDEKKKEIIYFDENRVKTINSALKSVHKEVLTRNEKIQGILVAVDNKKKTLIIQNADENFIKIKVRDDSLQEVKMITNQIYSLFVEIESKITEFNVEAPNEKYYLDTVFNL